MEGKDLKKKLDELLKEVKSIGSESPIEDYLTKLNDTYSSYCKMLQEVELPEKAKRAINRIFLEVYEYLKEFGNSLKVKPENIYSFLYSSLIED